MKNFAHEILEVLSQAEKLYTRENLWISIKFHKAEKKIFKRDGIEKENSLKYFFLFIKAFASYLNTNKLQKNVIITNIISWKWSFFFIMVSIRSGDEYKSVYFMRRILLVLLTW